MIFSSAGRIARVTFGLAVVALGLARMAAVPLLGFIALGYLLEVEGRIARGERLRDSLPWLPQAPRLGGTLLTAWVFILPVRLLWSATLDARIIAPETGAAQWLFALTLCAGSVAVVNLGIVAARGGDLGGGFWPPGNLRWLWRRLRSSPRQPLDFAHRARELWEALDLPNLFFLGVRGGGGAFLWLWAPTLLWAVARGPSPKPALAVLGALLLLPILFWLPIVQTRFAAEGKFRALFELRAANDLFRRAPLAWSLALITLYAITLPLFFLRVFLPPTDAAWAVALVFVVVLLPARISLAWAYRRASRGRANPSAWVRRPARLALLLLLAAYAVLLFLAPLIDTHGNTALLAHPAFLVPSPF